MNFIAQQIPPVKVTGVLIAGQWHTVKEGTFNYIGDDAKFDNGVGEVIWTNASLIQAVKSGTQLRNKMAPPPIAAKDLQ